MQLVRRAFLKAAGLAAAMTALPRAVSALDYPTRPVRIVAGFAAGGGVDITARLIGQWFTEHLGQSFVTENRPGAGGNIGTEAVVNAAAVASAPILPRAASALDYPTRPVKIVAGFAAGGGVDITARLIGQWLTDHLGQSFVTENRPGAGGNIGTETVVNASADGYTLLLATVPNAVNASLYSKLNFNFIRDIAPIGGIIRVPMKERRRQCQNS